MLPFYTANFYQIRNMPKTMLPISINLNEPKWFHDNKGRTCIFQDKRKVWNGVYINELSSSNLEGVIEDCCKCPEIKKKTVDNCSVVKAQLSKLRKLNFQLEILKLENLAKQYNCSSICFVVFEKPEFVCGERSAIKKWFEENGVNIKEFYPIQKIKNTKFSLNFKRIK